MIEMLLGHILGDYMLQTYWMATKKTEKSLIGWIAAIIHSLIYTFSVCLMMWNFNLLWIISVFLSHVFIDHYSIGKWFMIHIKKLGLPKFSGEKGNELSQKISLTAIYWINYVVVDNGMHIFLMYGMHNLIFDNFLI